ncbi:helix-turn-helix domain-containing protein [Chloroflexota bacterium]
MDGYTTYQHTKDNLLIMPTNTIRKTPFLFLRYLVLIEFFFAFLPLIATLIIPIQAEYNETALAQELSYNVLLTIVLTILQILIVSISFFSWYLPLFKISQQSIAYRRAGSAEFGELIRIDAIKRVKIRQGWLARRLDYGTLLIYGNYTESAFRIKDIPNPIGTANQIEKWVAEKLNLKPAPEINLAVELIADGEGQFVEFKSSILWDYRQEKMNKNLSVPIIKNVAAFMNTAGGTLLIGIDDDGKILGLEADYAIMKKSNPDGFELIFNNAFAQMIGAEFRHLVQLSFPEIEGLIICLVAVQPSTSPVYFRHHGKEDFYIRAGNASQPLPISKATNYIHDRFQS